MSGNVVAPDKDQIKEIVCKNWITHDAMWFYHCLKEFGIEKTNQLNKAAIRDMSTIEIKRIQKALHTEKITSFAQFTAFMDQAMAIATGKFMKYTYTTPAHNLMRGEWESCFAYEGMKALGVADRYECGVMLRINTWLETMGIQYEIEPQIAGCMMYTEGKCYRNYKYFFDQ